MKFVCPRCEARYQIGDDKLSSRASPRMKCRKCGFMIDIRRSGPDTASAPALASERPAGGPPQKPLPVPPPAPGGGLLGEELDTAAITAAVAESAGTMGVFERPAGGAAPPDVTSSEPIGRAAPDEGLGDVGAAWMSGASSAAAPPSVVSAPPSVASADPPVSEAPYSRGFMELHEAAGLGRPKRMTGFAWALVAAAYGLGVATGVFLLGAEAPSSSSAVPSSERVESGESESAPRLIDERADAAGLAVLAGGAALEPAPAEVPTAAPRTAVAPSPKPSTEGKGLLSGLTTPGQAGPNVDPGGDEGSSGSTASQLSSAQIQRTVSANTAGVRRACWQRALDGRDLGAPSTARVSVSMTVAPSGQVGSVSSSGDPRGYPGLSSCIERRVAAWSFPRSGSSTTVNVPFVFAAQ